MMIELGWYDGGCWEWYSDGSERDIIISHMMIELGWYDGYCMREVCWW